MVTPNDLAARRGIASPMRVVRSGPRDVVREVIDESTTEIEYVMAHWLDAGYTPDQSIALASITLANVLDTDF